MFDGGVDPDRWLARVWDSYGEPKDYHFLVYGVRETITGGLRPVPRVVVGGPERAVELIRDFDAHQPETHGGIPIFRVDYEGAA
jgi:hypothetical protein